MTRSLPLIAAVLILSVSPIAVHAAEKAGVKTEAAKGSLAMQLHDVEEEWARIKYQVPSKEQKLADIAKLETRIEGIANANASSADAKIWQAIVLATDANITKSLSGLPKVEKAKALLEQSLKIDPKAMNGAAHMTLGSLYYQVPGWPVSYGNDDLAEQHLKAALAINPDGMDTNYWYGAFLLDDGRNAQAVPVLEKAASAPIRSDRKVADEGRLKEIKDALAQAQAGVKKKAGGND